MPRPPVQARSLATYQALVRAGLTLVEQKNFEEITVAELAREAGCSVGAFYTKFGDKTDLFRALVRDVLEHDTEFDSCSAPPTLSDAEVCMRLVTDFVQLYRRHKGLYRAALRLSMSDASIWEPLKERGRLIADLFAARLGPAHDEADIRFGVQILAGVLNNAILIGPGLALEDPKLELQLRQALLRLLRIDGGATPAGSRGRSAKARR